ncbi:phage holin family protein [Pseudomonas rubra]|uniref:Type II holin n=1 Tax=Pseudomonas rubra TaxID=2942627 RepID=A0ABT5P6D4_9PSED|nr:type II holin [Pseudomonas rubra]MDD1013843.1 type II holin [Pseudomonas rubra]MDD1038336.1 type II holin [Pseudomonas rubra]MDD1154574.1 type II holin [Pseudomonas rubra]
MSVEMDFQNGVIKYAPVAVGAGADVASRFAGLSLSDWFYVALITYTVAQTVVLVFRTIMEERRKNKEG